MEALTNIKQRYSGHETFVCRYAWLPKVVNALSESGGENLFKNENDAMVALGLGKNMVRSAKFWAESAQVIENFNGGMRVTPFGNRLLGYEAHDPYLERPETLWLIHWKISTNPQRPLFHWDQMLNYWHRSEFTESEVLPFLERGLPPDQTNKSTRTLGDGFRVFVNSYVPSTGKKGEIAEDNLDCPLAELDLIRLAGERNKQDGHREQIYTFNVEPKPGISPTLFAYCIRDFWRNGPQSTSTSMGFRVISTNVGSPGQIFKLPESFVRNLLDQISTATQGAFTFEESQSMQQVWRKKEISNEELLDNIYL